MPALTKLPPAVVGRDGSKELPVRNHHAARLHMQAVRGEAAHHIPGAQIPGTACLQRDLLRCLMPRQSRACRHCAACSDKAQDHDAGSIRYRHDNVWR